MPKAVFKILPLLAVVVFLTAGCASSKKVSVRGYIQDKERVDQEYSGKVGNWEASPDAVEPEDRKETRKIYVLELSKEADDQDNKVFKLNASDEPQKDAVYVTENSVEQTEYEMKQPPDITLPVGPGIPGTPRFPGEPQTLSIGNSVEYTIEKDDTMQKISKKFYNSFSKWPRIYEANKDKIKNPDFLQPGVMITIPMD